MRIVGVSTARAAKSSSASVAGIAGTSLRPSSHVRGHENVLKRLLIHASAFNLGLWMPTLFGIGTPRALQGRVLALLILLWTLIDETSALIWTHCDRPPQSCVGASLSMHTPENATCATGC